MPSIATLLPDDGAVLSEIWPSVAGRDDRGEVLRRDRGLLELDAAGRIAIVDEDVLGAGHVAVLHGLPSLPSRL
jgi:hypothetical protein